MRFIFLFLSASVTVGLCLILNTQTVFPVALGKLLSPQEGIWQNAESVNQDFSGNLILNGLSGKVDVYFDDRLVPHVFAENQQDAYFAEGYLHAKFRLWQMEFQTMYAAGRTSEVLGNMALTHDREFRRLGMVYAAEQALAEMEKDPVTKKSCDAYTAGVNSFINTLSESQLPIEYKLLGYKPEKWSNLKSAIFLKYMSYDLSGYEHDFEMTEAKKIFTKTDFNKLFPVMQDSLDPIVSRGTAFPVAAMHPIAPADADSVYFNFKKDSFLLPEAIGMPDKNNGSNSWAVAAFKTATGAPILCNDPHLGLNLPSEWFEIQLSVPACNVYGVSFPGAPGIMIGFNDSAAFGFTNAGIDVKDYYEIKFKDISKQSYWFDSSWVNTTFRIEKIKIAGEADYIDTVAYTLFGPVMYDQSFRGKKNTGDKNYAVRWSAHDPSNEFRFFYELNQAKNYSDFQTALSYLHNPGQNCIFACKHGDIAMQTQGRFPAKWPGQGDFVMPGFDSSYLWQGMIPSAELPFQYNPARGFVSSANQRPADSTYPYYLGRDFPIYRGIIINRKLQNMEHASVKDMMNLQTDNYNVFAEMAVPLILKNISTDKLSNEEKLNFALLQNWNLRNDFNALGATVFALTWKIFKDTVISDEYALAPLNAAMPSEATLLEAVIKDSAFSFIDDIKTTRQESLNDVMTMCFKVAVTKLQKLKSADKFEWGKYKDTYISHLLRIPSFGRFHLAIGGETNAINAAEDNHGPSWRMIVNLTPQTEAYGIYPCGQSGNPGSRFYDNGIEKWVEGTYYSLWMMQVADKNNPRIKWKMTCSKS